MKPVWLVSILAVLVASPGFASESPGYKHRQIQGLSPVREPPAAIFPEGLIALIDEEMQRQQEEDGVIGAAVSVVIAGQPFLVRGYGDANIATGKKVDGYQTLFRVGSISKLFTATAAMQQVQDGLLELDADVRSYLPKERMPLRLKQPVSLRQLLTHAGGFEANTLGYLPPDNADNPRPLGVILGQHVPAQVRPPIADFGHALGTAYCNWCIALAGYMAQRVDNRPFQQLADERLFEPLDMRYSSFREPLPEHLNALMATGYDWETPPRPQPFEDFHDMAPAASLSTTAGDMAKFMIAQLGHSRQDAERVLRPELLKLMQSRQVNPNDFVNGAGLTWMAKYWNDHRVIYHDGATLYFYAELQLLPEADFGLFVAYNRPVNVRGKLMGRIMDRYFRAKLPPLRAPGWAPSRQAYEGEYVSTVRSLTTWEKVLDLLATVRVVQGPQGQLLIGPSTGGLDRAMQSLAQLGRGFGRQEPLFSHVLRSDAGGWIEAESQPGVFRAESGQAMRSFAAAEDGSYYMLGDNAFEPSVRIGPLESPAYNARWLAYCVGSCLLGLLTFPILLRRAAAGRRLALCAIAACLLNLAFLYGLARILTGDTVELLFQLPWWFFAVMTLGLMGSLLWPVQLIVGMRAWAQLAYGWRVLLVNHLTAMLAFVAWLYFWNLLGYQVA